MVGHPPLYSASLSPFSLLSLLFSFFSFSYILVLTICFRCLVFHIIPCLFAMRCFPFFTPSRYTGYSISLSADFLFQRDLAAYYATFFFLFSLFFSFLFSVCLLFCFLAFAVSNPVAVCSSHTSLFFLHLSSTTNCFQDVIPFPLPPLNSRRHIRDDDSEVSGGAAVVIAER